MEEATLDTISADLLFSVKMNRDYEGFIEKLANYSEKDLHQDLNHDEIRKVFWINLYNAFFQILRKREHLKHPEIFKKKCINISGLHLSLDDIEHGILRRFRSKLSLGYLPNLFVSKTIKKLAVNRFDFRIHFALNCGAESCPPIAFYSLNKISEQLDMASESFINSESKLDSKNQTLFTSKLFLWYRADFGGKVGIRKIIGQYLKKDLSSYRIRFQNYSWNEKLDNYSS